MPAIKPQCDMKTFRQGSSQMVETAIIEKQCSWKVEAGCLVELPNEICGQHRIDAQLKIRRRGVDMIGGHSRHGL